MFSTSLLSGLKPDPYVDLVEWSNTYRQLPRESSIEPGQYRTSRTPYVEEILWELSPQSPTEEVVAVKPTQIGFTEIANNFLFSIAHLYPGPCMFAQPTNEMAEDHSKSKVQPSVDAMPCLQDKIRPPREKDSGNTLLRKEFPGGYWKFTGSNSPVSARSRSIRYLIRDDYDGFVDSKEGDTGELLKKRTDSFGSRRKIYTNSTPTNEGSSKIWAEFETSSQGHYHVPCPYCGKYQYLEWGGADAAFGIKFERDDDGEISSIHYQCVCCHGKIEEFEKTWMLENGYWKHDFPGRKKRGFRLNSFYSPLGWVSWAQIAKEVIDAHGDKEKSKALTNTRFAEVWKEFDVVREEDAIMALRDDRPFGAVPGGNIISALTCQIDTQDFGFWYEVRAWGYGMERESWQVRAGFVTTFGALEQIIFEDVYDGYSVHLAIQDAMGHRTSEVYDFALKHRNIVIPFQGQQTKAQPYGFSKMEFYPGTDKRLPGGLQLLQANVTYFKNMLNSKLNIAPGDPGAWHMSAEMSLEWARQMTAEFINEKSVWECPKHRQNHAWDVSYMGLVAAELLGLKYRDKDKVIAASQPKPKRKVLSRGIR